MNNEHSQSKCAAKQAKDINVGEFERMASGVIGAYLMLKGMRGRSIGGLTMMGSGAAMLYRAVTGHCDMYSALGINTATGKNFEQNDKHDEDQHRNVEWTHADVSPYATAGQSNPMM